MLLVSSLHARPTSSPQPRPRSHLASATATSSAPASPAAALVQIVQHVGPTRHPSLSRRLPRPARPGRSQCQPRVLPQPGPVPARQAQIRGVDGPALARHGRARVQPVRARHLLAGRAHVQTSTEDSGYVQWFFPIRERGVNPSAQPLQPHEITAMAADPAVMRRLLRSYTMMLAFYGIDFNGGHLRRTNDWKERFSNLSHAPHNLLRLTRILKNLSEFPTMQPHAAPLVAFFVAQHADGRLDFSPARTAGQSMERWWARCFRAQEEREEVAALVMVRGGFGEGKWGEQRFEAWVRDRAAAGKAGWTG